MGEVFSKQRGQKIRNKSRGGAIKGNRYLEYGENRKANKPQAYFGPLCQTKKLVLDFLFYKLAQWCGAHYGWGERDTVTFIILCFQHSGKNKAQPQMRQISCAKTNTWTAIAYI